jgi:hypothetical protein
MLRNFIRLLGFAALVAGFVMGVVDGARSLAGKSFELTPLGSVLFWLMPRQFPIIEPAITRHVHPLLWDPVLLNLFLLPTAVVLFALGALFLLITRRRTTPVWVSGK